MAVAIDWVSEVQAALKARNDAEDRLSMLVEKGDDLGLISKSGNTVTAGAPLDQAFVGANEGNPADLAAALSVVCAAVAGKTKGDRAKLRKGAQKV